MKISRELIPVTGFRFGGLNIGLKNESLDFGGIVANSPCAAAAVFTKNNFPGAPVIVGREHVADGKLQAIVVNSKNANVATGAAGIEASRNTCRWLGEELNISPEMILPSSTGVIGRPLDTTKIRTGCKILAYQLGEEVEYSERFAKAIMTTDHHPKFAHVVLEDGTKVLGIAKGAGMVEPNMATMLSYIVSDGDLNSNELRTALHQAVNQSFNRISIDTDTSTSDTVVLLSAGYKKTNRNDFQIALNDLCCDLAKQIVQDGEGATKLIELKISGAQDDKSALLFAKSVINSPLVKTAIYGADPNWGRFVMAIGKVFDFPIPLESLKIYFGKGAKRVCLDAEHSEDLALVEALRPLLQAKEVFIEIELGMGISTERVWGCDLSEGYVAENAYYTT
jgi:glutamate N-acetyltransferase/amino-acid N-acetyltransferase